MTSRQIVLDIPEKVLLAENTDEASFAREMRILAAGKHINWAAYLPGAPPRWSVWPGLSFC